MTFILAYGGCDGAFVCVVEAAGTCVAGRTGTCVAAAGRRAAHSSVGTGTRETAVLVLTLRSWK